MIDSNLVKKIRGIQGSRIKQSKKNVTFSQVVEDVIRKSLKNMKDKSLQLIINYGMVFSIFTGICLFHGIRHSFHSIGSII